MTMDPNSPRTLGAVAAVFSAFFVFLIGGSAVLKVWVDQRNVVRDAEQTQSELVRPVVKEQVPEKTEKIEPVSEPEKNKKEPRKVKKQPTEKPIPEKLEPEPPPPMPPPKAKKTGEGKVMVTGNVTRVWFYGPTGRFGPGKVPAGSYHIQATFKGSGPTMAGMIEVNGGDRLVVSCSAGSKKCVRR